MKQRRSGCIINVASVAGHVAVAPMAAYAASQFRAGSAERVPRPGRQALNIRVAIVGPGIIDTQMAKDMGRREPRARIASSAASRPCSPPRSSLRCLPSVVAGKILEIAVGDTTQLRHPVGPDAEPFLGWRRGMCDEAWVELGGMDDAGWYDRIEADFGWTRGPRREHRRGGAAARGALLSGERLLPEPRQRARHLLCARSEIPRVPGGAGPV